ncbi:MAG: hypothetical protein QMD66_07660 [Actinomycetota bacterium]|nr:hypothetical protein [Actinomycetota bacterium]MDI6822702.1 hypothetical protein [Actinomycetota bacterium]
MKDEIKNFRDLPVWQKAHKLFLETVEDVNKFPKNKVAIFSSNSFFVQFLP